MKYILAPLATIVIAVVIYLISRLYIIEPPKPTVSQIMGFLL